MDRRVFLKSSLLSLLVALNPFRAEGNKFSTEGASLVEGGIAFEQDTPTEIISTYCAPKGVLIWGDMPEGTPGCLFQDLTLSVTVHKTHPRSEVHGLMMKMIGPSAILKAAYGEFGDVTKAVQNTMKFGLIKEDNSRLWFKCPKVVLTSIGMSVSTQAFTPGKPDKNNDVFQPRFPGDDGGMIITEMVEFLGCAEPELCDAPGKTPDELLTSRHEASRRSFFGLGEKK